MAFSDNFVLKSDGSAVTDTQIESDAIGTEYQKNTGEVYVKTAANILEKVDRTILSLTEMDSRYVNASGDSLLAGSMIPETDNVIDLGSLTNRFQDIFSSTLNTDEITAKTNIIIHGDILPNANVSTSLGTDTERLLNSYITNMYGSNLIINDIQTNNDIVPKNDNVGSIGLSGTAYNNGFINNITSNVITINNRIQPDTDTGADIGTSTKSFNNVYGLQFSGNAVSASHVYSTQRDTNAFYYLNFSEGTASANKSLSHDNDIMVNPGTNTIRCDNFDGNASSATILKTARKINNVSFNGSADITIKASTTKIVTFDENGGSQPGVTFDGSLNKTISYNSVGAPSVTGKNASGSWNIDIKGNSATTNKLQKTENNITVIHVPDGATYSAGANQTGAIKVRLPQSWTDTPISFKVRLYDDVEQKTVEFLISGLNKSRTSSWVNCSVNRIGAFNINHKVHFAHDGSKCCVFIGDIDTVWQSPKVTVTDVQIGNNRSNTNNSIVKWNKNWSISLQTTTLPNVTKVISSQNHGSGSGLDADLLDGVHGSKYLRNDVSNLVLQNALHQYSSQNNGFSTSTAQSSLEVYQDTAQSDAFMSFHILNDFQCHFGLDGTSNDLFVGGGSYGTVKHKIWHSGNDGSGSGLNADLLDGHQAKDFSLSRTRVDWNDAVGTGWDRPLDNVVGQLSWANYGNNHTVFDASSGFTPDGDTISFTETNSPWQPNYPMLVGWNGTNTYGVKVDTARYSSLSDHAGDSDKLNGLTSTFFSESRGRTNWNSVPTSGFRHSIDTVVGQLAWKNYGNNHTIYDASSGLAPNGVAKNRTNPDYAWTATYPTLMGWNGVNTYGVRVDSARIADSASNADMLDGAHANRFLKIDTSHTVNLGTRHTYQSYNSGGTTTTYQSGLEIYNSNSGKDAFLQFHVAGDYACYFGLDGNTNDLFVGGWSMGIGKNRIYHAGNFRSGSVHIPSKGHATIYVPWGYSHVVTQVSRNSTANWNSPNVYGGNGWFNIYNTSGSSQWIEWFAKKI